LPIGRFVKSKSLGGNRVILAVTRLKSTHESAGSNRTLLRYGNSKMRRSILLLIASIILGLASWILFGQCYQFAIESLKLGYAPWYERLLLPVTLLTGFAGSTSAYFGLRMSARHCNSQSIAWRYKLAGWFSFAPAIIIALLRS